MPDIRYVCLSDTHFGEEDSLLTNLKTASTDTDPSRPSPVLVQLVNCLKHLIAQNEQNQKPTLILNGDILELALTTTNEAAMAFERFVECIMPPGEELFDRIIYIPGNHDHHLWETARETQYTEYIGEILPGQYLPIPFHTTSMFTENSPRPLISYFLTRLIRRYEHLEEKQINVAYPNFGLFDHDGRKSVIFSHGHYIEPLYQLMSFLRNLMFPDREKPLHIWDIEAENFAWIDFFWSTMGRSGGAGKDVELIYEKMQDKEAFKKMLNGIVDSLADEYDLPGWDLATAKILKHLVSQAVDRIMDRERARSDGPLSDEAEEGLWAYMNGPLKEQILIEQNQNMLRDVTFIFGHTHKPFQEDMNFRGYPEWVNVYNTGGWIVESIDPEPLHGGAVVLVDEDLNTTSLRMYNEAEDFSEYTVTVEEATHADEGSNPFHDRMRAMVDPDHEPWISFRNIVARTVRKRAQNLRDRIRSNSRQ